MFKTKEEFKYEFSKRIIETYGRTVEESHITEKFMILENMVRDYASVNWAMTKMSVQKHEQKQVHYFSMEFLMGRLLVNNMMNLGIYDIAKEGLADYGINIHELEELESDAGLGNGGLGRLAACFMDSLASLSYPAFGHTIRYTYGFFEQKIEDGYQVEVPDQWLRLGNAWEVRKPKHQCDVKFFGHVVWNGEKQKWEHVDAELVRAVPYDVPIVGADTKVTNTLRLWKSEPADDIPRNKDFRQYTQEVNDITQTLYPDDSTPAGKMLRLKQQYFFVAAGLNSIVRAHLRVYPDLHNFAQKNVIQLNDTHPVLVIPELMRILIDDYEFEWDEAWEIVTHTCAYTNHTILAEALEKWPIEMMKNLLPRIYQIIEEIHRRFIGYVKIASNGDEQILNRVMILRDGQVHMARLAIAGSFSVNGVAALHTDILKNREMQDFDRIFPGKFNNKTNGVTHRRWLAYCNPQLSDLLHEAIGDSWIKHPDDLEKLKKFADDSIIRSKFLNVKYQRKEDLARYIKEHNGIEVDVNSIFDIQVKRLHAYKRQLLNIMHVIYLYQRMKEDPSFRIYPHTYIFGAKAAPSYYFAKKVIKLINAVADVVNNDPVTNQYLKVVFIENYGVTIAEHIIPAADVSEQISTAGKEASGTSNMKFMMNGAITLGTLDGANVEIAERVGDENCVIFGMKVEDINKLKADNSYHAWDYYNNDFRIKKVVDSLTDGTFASSREEFKLIFDELMSHNDEYYLLADFDSYVKAQEKINALYQDRENWAKMCIMNIAMSGYFSSDRTIEDYVKDIWHLERVANK